MPAHATASHWLRLVCFVLRRQKVEELLFPFIQHQITFSPFKCNKGQFFPSFIFPVFFVRLYHAAHCVSLALIQLGKAKHHKRKFPCRLIKLCKHYYFISFWKIFPSYVFVRRRQKQQLTCKSWRDKVFSYASSSGFMKSFWFTLGIFSRWEWVDS